MREIKFRAWDKKLKRMCQCHTVELVDDVEGRPGVYVEKNKDTVRWLDAGTYELMQFTGLKDKNGKDIWEGDILSVPAEGTWPEYKYIVDFWHGSFVAKETGSSGLNNYPNNFNFRVSEVIGNIYENPELLTP